MAQPIGCDLDGCQNAGDILVTLIATGDVQGVCGEHVPMFAAVLLDPYGLMVADKAPDPDTDEETDEDQAAPKGAARPRRRRRVAVGDARGGPELAEEASDTPPEA